MKRKLLFFSLIAAVAAACMLLRPMLFITAGEDVIYTGAATEGKTFAIKFRHSVQKTPVEETLAVDGKGFLLLSTKYRSFGVGLPFSAEEGNFRQEGNNYILDNMNRHYDKLSLRVGEGTNLTIVIDGITFNLCEMFPPGTKIDIYIAPRNKLF